MFIWIFRARLTPQPLAALSIAGAASALGLAGVWLVTRGLGWFDPDPRLVAYGDFADLAAVGFLVLLATLLGRGLFLALTAAPSAGVPTWALLATLVLAECALVGFTLPARGGQNRDCAYGPIREDSGLSHATPPVPIHLEVGETRSVVVLLLVVCGPDPVAITSLEPLQTLADAIALEQITIDRTPASRAERVHTGPGEGTPAVVALLQPNQGRYPVVVQVRGLNVGTQSLSAFSVQWAGAGQSGSLGFASSTFFCVGDAPCPRLPGR